MAKYNHEKNNNENNNDNSMVHVHAYNILTDVAEEHQHIIMGVSSPARRKGRSHVHSVRGRTSYSDGHWHSYEVTSGPAIEIDNGGHTHYFDGETSYEDGHSHNFEGIVELISEYDEDNENSNHCPNHKNGKMY